LHVRRVDGDVVVHLLVENVAVSVVATQNNLYDEENSNDNNEDDDDDDDNDNDSFSSDGSWPKVVIMS